LNPEIRLIGIYLEGGHVVNIASDARADAIYSTWLEGKGAITIKGEELDPPAEMPYVEHIAVSRIIRIVVESKPTMTIGFA
jgi:hypothetical protein